MKRFALLALVLAAGFSSVRAGESQWSMDRSHSSITFSIRHMVVSEVVGSFKNFTVSLDATKDDFSDARVAGTIQVGSISTDNDRRDAHLKSDDFFNAEKFPEIRFTGTEFRKVGDNKYQIAGNLTIRDVTKPVVFDAVYEGAVKAWGKTVSAWKATTTIDRFDYNLKWDKTIETGGLIAGRDVTITLNREFDK